MKIFKKNILVTGGAGFIGKNLVRELLRKGNEVTIVDNLSLGREEDIPSGVNFIKGDMMQFPTIVKEQNWGNDFDAIYHLGSPCSVIQFNKNPVTSLHSTIKGFANINDYSIKYNIRLIYPSSGNVYGTQPAFTQCNMYESLMPNPNNLYGIGKYTLETLARQSCSNSIGLRIFAGYGPGEEHKGDLSCVVTQFILQALMEKKIYIWGTGKQTRDFVYIDDIIKALTKAELLRPTKYDIINVGTGVDTTFLELATLIESSMFNLGILNENQNIEIKNLDKPDNYVERAVANTNLMQEALGFKGKAIDNVIQGYVRYLWDSIQ